MSGDWLTLVALGGAVLLAAAHGRVMAALAGLPRERFATLRTGS